MISFHCLSQDPSNLRHVWLSDSVMRNMTIFLIKYFKNLVKLPASTTGRKVEATIPPLNHLFLVFFRFTENVLFIKSYLCKLSIRLVNFTDYIFKQIKLQYSISE